MFNMRHRVSDWAWSKPEMAVLGRVPQGKSCEDNSRVAGKKSESGSNLQAANEGEADAGFQFDPIPKTQPRSTNEMRVLRRDRVLDFSSQARP